MTANPHARTPALGRGAPLAAATIAVIDLHGRELGAASAIELADRLAIPGAAFVIPEADARSWYPASFLAPTAQNQPRLDHALARIDGLVDELGAAGFAPERIFVLGFSQGACLALEWFSRHPERAAGAIAFTGGLIGPPETRWPASPIAGAPVLLTTSDADEWVPLARVHATRDVFAARGARVELHVLAGRPHRVDDREVAVARALLADAIAAHDRARLTG